MLANKLESFSLEKSGQGKFIMTHFNRIWKANTTIVTSYLTISYLNSKLHRSQQMNYLKTSVHSSSARDVIIGMTSWEVPWNLSPWRTGWCSYLDSFWQKDSRHLIKYVSLRRETFTHLLLHLGLKMKSTNKIWMLKNLYWCLQ